MKVNLLDITQSMLIAAAVFALGTAGSYHGETQNPNPPSAAQTSPAAAPLPTLDDVTSYLRFDTETRKELLDGQVVSGPIDEATDRELAVSVAMLDHRPMAVVVKEIHDLRDLEGAKFHILGDPPNESDFADAGFAPTESSEAAHFLEAKPGSDFNLSSEEYRQLAALAKSLDRKTAKTPAGLEAINNLQRQFLRDRYAAYRTKGLNGIARYDRNGSKTSRPQDDLFAADASSGKFLARFFPQLQQSLTGYPDHQVRELALEHQFFWSRDTVEARPTFILSHRVYMRDANYALIVQRQFYVSHSYNAMQIVVGCLPHGDGTLVFYTNRTATDRVAGMASGLAHKIGRNQMRKEIIEQFQRLREEPQSAR